MNTREQDRLIQEALDGEISDADFEALQEILMRDPEARGRWYDYAKLWQALGHRRAGQKRFETGYGRAIRASQHRRTLRQTLLLAAAAVVLIAMALWLIPTPPPRATLSFRTSHGSLFTVLHSPVKDGAPPESGTMEVGSMLELIQGTIELELKTDVTAVVRAPARLTLHRDDRIHLDHGTAWFRVGKQGHGFSVVTPEIEVIDLGTEFGVISTQDAHDEAHCLDGEVMVRGLGPRKAESALQAGNALKADPTGELVPTPLREGDFLRSLPKGLAHFHWSFNGRGDERIQPVGDHPLVGHIQSKSFPRDLTEGMRVGEGRFGEALRFDGSPDYIVTDWPGVLKDAPRSVAMWIRLPASQRLTPMHLAAWGEGWNPVRKGGLNQAFFVGLSKSGASQLADSAAGGPRSVPVVSFGGIRYFCLTADVHDGRWHHLAWVYHGGQLSEESPAVTFYFDGETYPLVAEDGTTATASGGDDSIDTRPQTPLVIGARLSESQAEEVALESGFIGEMDELYVVEGAISPETAGRLFKQNRLN